MLALQRKDTRNNRFAAIKVDGIMFKKTLPVETLESAGDTIEKTSFSRRGLLLGIPVAGLALGALMAPAKATAVSMLRSGVDPDLVEPESDVEEIARRRWWRRRRRARRYYRPWRRGYSPYWGRRRWRRRGVWVGVGI